MAARVRLLLVLCACVPAALACTTIIVSGGATVDGVPMLAHTVDCWDCDNRVALVPSRDHAPNATHHVFGMGHQYPRITSDDRAWIYRPQPGVPRAPVLGHIPEVNHTYAVWEANYALMNEHGLSVGESSSAAKVPQGPGVDLEDPKTGEKGAALFSIGALIAVMLGRCRTARCAIATAGALAEEHGFYGEGWGSGESLTLVDSTGEAWIFHISADPTHASAYWAAQRVPEGHMAVIANSYILREIDTTDPEHFMWSSNLLTSTVQHGLWDGHGVFSWAAVLADYSDRPWYASVRLYSVYNRVAKSLGVQPLEDPRTYPMSVPVDRKMDKEDLMDLFRTFYQDNEFDMQSGVLAGWFGLPYRLEIGDEGRTDYPDLKGMFARGLSIPRTAYCIVAHPAPDEPVLYLAMDMPATSVFVPFLARTLTEASQETELEATMGYYASAYATGVRTEFSRESAWWAFDFVANWMTVNFRNMSVSYVYPAVAEWQPKALEAAAEHTTQAATAIQEALVEAWWALADKLVVRYNDNYLNFPEHAPEHVFTIGYEEQFMRMVGYDESFIRPQSVLSPKACEAESHAHQPADGGQHGGLYSLLAQLVAAVTLLLVGMGLGVRIGAQRAAAAVTDAEQQGYQPLNDAGEQT